jgi:hypothetical protein
MLAIETKGVEMPRIRIECDQRFLKPHSEIESALRKHGRVDARKIADLASGPHAVFIEVHDSEQAEDLVDTLNEITDVRATIIDAEITE